MQSSCVLNGSVSLFLAVTLKTEVKGQGGHFRTPFPAVPPLLYAL